MSHEAYLRSKDIAGLHALRAFAIAAVIAHHAGVGGIVHRGVLGVGTFFTISGFIVTTLLLREHARTGTIALRRFHTRRALRLWPLYFAVLGAYTALVIVAERNTADGARFFENLPHFLTFTANWAVPRNVGGRVIFAFAWSLATQEQFFLAWPSLLRLGRAGIVPVVLLALVPLGELGVVAARHANVLGEGAFISRFYDTTVFSPICVGALLAFALHAPGGFRVAQRLAGRAWSAPAALALTACGAWFDWVPSVLFYVAVAGLIAAAVLAGNGLWRRFLAARPLVHVGTVSYGVYLLHMLALNAARKLAAPASPLLAFALAVPIAVVAATVSYHLFERRVLLLRDRLTEHAHAERWTLATLFSRGQAHTS